ncbi:glycerophosphodiester phosphodiesterase family protein [Kordiimonas gwangyangensis]|uniref:glycerophosphodiester phosphodiesterase family protein n=1 Tax=Kordiimonas gwangyangensis TaxID=288022 RepID=UPI0003684738|nr:glycerophosphodiester phosphodiesterase family protein [Kordiimonas gwangyangensis]
MQNIFRTFVALIVATFLSWTVSAETVPQPTDPDVRYYIEVPSGGLPAFFRYHPMRVPLVSHHRGGPAPGYPENAIETMDNALRYGFGLMEVDVAELRDGSLILMHDDTLDRTTTGQGGVTDKTLDDILKLQLVDNEGVATSYKVPTLQQALSWAVGKAILTLDIKRGTDFAKVAAAVKAAGAEDYAVAITYSLDQAKSYYEIAPWMMQTISMYDEEDIAAVKASGIEPSRVIAWTGTRQQAESFYAAVHAEGWRTISGTFALDKELAVSGADQKYLSIYKLGVDVIATDRFWAVQGLIRNPNLFYFVRRPAALSKEN